MSLPITLFVPGVPAPQGSKRHVGRGVLIESSPLVKPWRATVAAACHEAGVAGLRLDAALHVSLRFAITRPGSHFGKRGLLGSAPAFPHRKPDIDKLSRSTLDALATDANVIADDARIVTLKASKHYADFPGVLITIAEVKP